MRPTSVIDNQDLEVGLLLCGLVSSTLSLGSGGGGRGWSCLGLSLLPEHRLLLLLLLLVLLLISGLDSTLLLLLQERLLSLGV